MRRRLENEKRKQMRSVWSNWCVVCMTSWHGATNAWFTKNESSECRIVCNQTKRNGTKQNVAEKGQSVVSVAIVWPSWHIETCPNKF